MMDFLIIQLIGFIGMACVVFSFQKNERSITLIAILLANTFFFCHFWLLDARTGAIMNAVAVFRTTIFVLMSKISWLRQSFVLYLIIGIFWIAGLATWQNNMSFLPIIAMTLECLALWRKENYAMRRIFLLSGLPWFAYNLFVQSYAGIITGIFISFSIITAIIRFDRKMIATKA